VKIIDRMHAAVAHLLLEITMVREVHHFLTDVHSDNPIALHAPKIYPHCLTLSARIDADLRPHIGIITASNITLCPDSVADAFSAGRDSLMQLCLTNFVGQF